MVCDNTPRHIRDSMNAHSMHFYLCAGLNHCKHLVTSESSVQSRLIPEDVTINPTMFIVDKHTICVPDK